MTFQTTNATSVSFAAVDLFSEVQKNVRRAINAGFMKGTDTACRNIPAKGQSHRIYILMLREIGGIETSTNDLFLWFKNFVWMSQASLTLTFNSGLL